VKVAGVNLTYEGLVPRIQKSFLSKDVDAMQPHIRAFVERAVTFTTCPECGGTRLNEGAWSSRIKGINIAGACAMQINDLSEWVRGLNEKSVAPLLASLRHTLASFVEIGLKQGGVDRATGTELYLLLEQLPQIFPTLPVLNSILRSMTDSGTMNIVLRSDVPMATLQPAIASAVREADPSLPVIGLRPMDDVISGSLRQPRILMHLFGGFAGLALLLAAIGTYGVLSYLVTQRLREIGIRMALGAGRETVLRSVMAHGLTLALVGLAAGLAAALVLTRLMEALLFEVRPNDPGTLAGVAALVTIVAAAASLVPAVRATRVDPIVALREE
jgi:FtsX-like permease family